MKIGKNISNKNIILSKPFLLLIIQDIKFINEEDGNNLYEYFNIKIKSKKFNLLT